jgi:hypothetical protein
MQNKKKVIKLANMDGIFPASGSNFDVQMRSSHYETSSSITATTEVRFSKSLNQFTPVYIPRK